MTSWWQPHADDPPGFVEWLQSITRYDPKHPAEVGADQRHWLRRFFETEGPTPAEVVERRYVAEQLAVAREAATAVLRDLDRTTSEQCRAVVEEDEWGSPRVGFFYTDAATGNRYGGFASSPVWKIEPAEVFAEVADEIQDQLLGVVVDGNWKCWPECRAHDAGLHAETRAGRAVWWCRRGRHEAAEIGRLGETEPAP